VIPLTLLYDNENVVFFSKNHKSRGVSKWIDIKYLIARDKVKDNIIIIQHINKRAILVDSLTNTLSHILYKEHIAGMGLVDELRCCYNI
jgi:hypothetical protein